MPPLRTPDGSMGIPSENRGRAGGRGGGEAASEVGRRRQWEIGRQAVECSGVEGSTFGGRGLIQHLRPNDVLCSARDGRPLVHQRAVRVPWQPQREPPMCDASCAIRHGAWHAAPLAAHGMRRDTRHAAWLRVDPSWAGAGARPAVSGAPCGKTRTAPARGRTPATIARLVGGRRYAAGSARYDGMRRRHDPTARTGRDGAGHTPTPEARGVLPRLCSGY